MKTKELFTKAISKLKKEKSFTDYFNYKLVECSYAGDKWTVKIAEYLDSVFIKHHIINL